MGMKAGGDDELNAEINVTPLVDVMLVLLIIFMITAPMMNTGVSLELPQVTAQAAEDPAGKLVMSISCAEPLDQVASGAVKCTGTKIFLGGTQVMWKELGAKLKANDRVQKEGKLYIEADTHLQYGVVITAMAVAKSSGVEHVMMLTNPTDNLKLEDLDQIAKH
ncbi:MAG: Biopolymer transport protein ExbD/TolR [Myxococcales bacterium]|nr:Biopolymer transport protein ExbD/TolR [Myxococcales bacterium]